MASVNIAGGDDQFNRYKMPSVVGKVEGRGNGIKTRIVNCYEVARALHRPPGYVCKFFGCELGAQTKINDEEGVYIVNGNFNQKILSDTLQVFIKMFVLCGNCQLPETDLKLKKNGNILQVCNACGSETHCDTTHKLCTYITNNPPDGKKKEAKGKGKGGKAERRARKAANGKKENTKKQPKANGGANGSNTAAAQSTVMASGADMFPLANAMDFDFDAEADRAAEGLANGGSADGDLSADDADVQWSVPLSEEAQKQRRQHLAGDMTALERDAKQEEEKDALKLRHYIDQGKKSSKVLAKAERLFGTDREVHGLLAAAVAGESKATVTKSVTDVAVPHLKVFGTPMEKEAQRAFLAFLDTYGQDEGLLPAVANILKAGFDEDVLEEEEIFKWHRSGDGSKEVKEKTKAVVEWLETAEEESEEEEEESDAE